MSGVVPLRRGLGERYHSAQVEAPVRLNTNESPFPPPAAWQGELAAAIAGLDFHRYPDRDAVTLRRGIAEMHGVSPDEVFCANGSNEVLQCLLLAFGGPGRVAMVFEPTYALHAHIARLTGTEVVTVPRATDARIDAGAAVRGLGEHRPAVTFVCSPNNPTGRLEDPEVVARIVAEAPGLVVVDEAYGQFASWSALDLRCQRETDAGADAGTDGLVVVRTFSKTWAMAGARLGYMVAAPEVVAGCQAAALPYHLSAQTQVAGVLALRYHDEMAERVRLVAEGRRQLQGGLSGLPVESWPSEANFVLFRPLHRDAGEVWKELLSAGVLVRDCTRWRGLEGCLRVTVGTAEENEQFLETLSRCLA